MIEYAIFVFYISSRLDSECSQREYRYLFPSYFRSLFMHPLLKQNDVNTNQIRTIMLKPQKKEKQNRYIYINKGNILGLIRREKMMIVKEIAGTLLCSGSKK